MNMDMPESRTSQVTILQAVITGFDELSQNLEPERVSELINKCYEMSNSVFSLYGGIIDHFTGREATVFFGFPDFIEKAPLKAVGAALDLVNKIAELNIETDFPVSPGIKVGINTGPVVIEKIGKDKHARDMVMGETVSMVSRICDIAESGQILVGQETYESVKDRFEFVVMEPVPLKGSKKLLPLFEVKGRKRAATTTGVSSSRMISSEMVGRKDELRQLEKQFMQLINGRGSVVNITGIAGIGKSRLMAEMREKELMAKVILLEGRALSNGKDLSFHPIVQIIKSWAGIKAEDSAEDALNKLKRGINRAYHEAFEEIFPFVATMMGYRLDGKAKERLKGIEGEALENLILKNLRDLLARAASVRPVVIVIEDAHWCDISSVIFLESLFKLVRKQRILFIVVRRPGHAETGERISNYLDENLKDHHLKINIEPLTDKESDKLIHNLLNKVNLPEEINQLIIDRAAGNPFFIEEVIRSFIDEGLIEVKDDQFLLTDNIKYANIPESIDNVLLSRIDRLDEKTKELLKTASVIGRNFYYKVLEEAAVTIEEVDHKLEYLKDVQLINERKKRDEVEFLFKHALAQQATYESILEKTKKELHLKIAVSIEKVFAGRIHEFYGMLAHHYSKAGQTDKMEEYLILAGDESMKSGASSEAVNYFKKALENHLQNNRDIPDRQKVIDLKEKLAFANFATGRFIEAVEYFDEVMAFYYKPFPKSKTRIILDFFYNLLILNKIMYSYKIAYNKPGIITQKLLKIIELKGHALTTIDPKRLFFESMYVFRFLKKDEWGNLGASAVMMNSCSLFYTGILFRLGIKSAEFALKFIEEADTIEWLRSTFNRSMYIYYAGKENLDLNEEKVFRLSLKLGDYWKVATFYVYDSYNAIEAGDEKMVIHLIKRLSTISETFDSEFPEIQYHRIKTALFIKFRKMDEVLPVTDESLKFASKTQYKLQIFLGCCYRSMALSILKNNEEAREYLVEAEKMLKDFNIKFCHCQYLLAKSYLELAQLKDNIADKRAGKSVLKTTEDLISSSGKVRKNLPEAHRLHAMVYHLLNKPDKAIKHFEKSMKAALSFGGNLELSRTYFEAGKFLRDPKNKKERLNGMNSTECLLKAKAMFEEMNLQWDLAEYEKYIGNHNIK